MKKLIYILLIPLAIFMTSCDALFDQADGGLSTEEIIEGLKTALKAGADSSVTSLSAADGYYGDKLVKIPLPPEAQPMMKYVVQIDDAAALLTGDGSGYVEKTIMSINRSAEEAAKDAKPIFVDAITGMSIEDGLNILQGQSSAKSDFDSIAATNYLKANTFSDLVGLYAPKIDVVLDKPLLGQKSSLSTNELWVELVKYYNYAIDAAIVTAIFSNDETIIALSLEPKIDANLTLGEFATGKALDGLFYKVGEEEKKIRRNPFEWVSDIIQKVFGSVFQE